MRFRAIALLLTLGLLAAPVPVKAQQAGKMYRIGVLRSSAVWSLFVSLSVMPDSLVNTLLAGRGYVLGKNLHVDAPLPAKSPARLAELAAELVALKVDVIVAAGKPAIRAATAATRSVPIVMLTESDPVLVTILARPAWNITGLTTRIPELSGKRLQLLTEVVPSLNRVGVLWNPDDVDKVVEWNEAQVAAKRLDLELQPLEVRSREDIERAMDKAHASAVLVLEDALTRSNRRLIANLAMTSRLPTMYPNRIFVGVRAGGLMSYGPSNLQLAERLATYIAKILEGTQPAQLPIGRPTRIEFVIYRGAAKALGLTIPPSVLIRADKIIE